MIVFTNSSFDSNSLISLGNFNDILFVNGVTASKKKFKYKENLDILMEKKVIFPKGNQKDFLVESRKKLGLTWPEFSKRLNVNRTTLEKSYRYEYCNFPYNLFIEICKLKNISEENLLTFYEAKIVDFDPLAIIGRKAFGERRTKLSDIKISFKFKPSFFDTSKIELSRYDKIKKLRFPKRLTPELAEEIGMSIGDGFLSNRRNEYRLKGNKNEKGYYDLFIKPLYKKLFNLDLNVREYETTYGFEIASKGFWTFKNKILGIPSGRKDNITVPNIVKVNDINILTSFVRGLFDTDGSVSFSSRYGYKNYYPTISISFKSKKLVVELMEILQMLGLEPGISKKDPYWQLYLNGYTRLEKYSRLIGWSNQKNIDRVIKWKKQYPTLSKEVYMADVA